MSNRQLDPERAVAASREDVLVLDLAGRRRERIPVVPDDATLALPRDGACGVVVSSTGAIDRGRKMHVYTRDETFAAGELDMTRWWCEL